MSRLIRLTRMIECRLVVEGKKVLLELPAEWEMPPILLERHPESKPLEMKPLFERSEIIRERTTVPPEQITAE